MSLTHSLREVSPEVRAPSRATPSPAPIKKEKTMSQGTLVIEINYNFKSDRVPPSLTQIRKNLDALKRHKYEYLKITDHECYKEEAGY